jgi:hypothetical protein
MATIIDFPKTYSIPQLFNILFRQKANAIEALKLLEEASRTREFEPCKCEEDPES